MFLKKYQSEGRHYVVPTMAPPLTSTSSSPALESLAIMAQNDENEHSSFSIFDLFRPSNLEDFGQQQGIREEDSLGAAGTLIYRPHHNIQYTDLVVQDGNEFYGHNKLANTFLNGLGSSLIKKHYFGFNQFGNILDKLSLNH